MLYKFVMKKYKTCSSVLLSLSLLTASMSVYSQNEDDVGIHQHRRVQARSILYGVHSKELHETMLRLNALISYPQNRPLPLDYEKTKFLQQLIDTANQLVKSAESLKEIDPGGDLGTEQVSTFFSLADQLRAEALDMEINTREMNIEALDKAFANMNQTCESCHRLFRGL
jgi:cytochrome c556